MNRYITDIVKFIAALLVVNGHLFAFFSTYTAVASWVNLGSQCVSLFLFFSGYGLMCSYQSKRDAYLHGFFSRRIGRVLLPLVTAYMATLPVYSLYQGAIDWNEVLYTLYWGGPYLNYSWYVTEILILYLLFYASIWVKDKLLFKGNEILSVRVNITVFTLLLMVIISIAKLPIWWLTGLPCFILGVWYSSLKDLKIANYFGIIAGILFLISFRWQDIANLCESLNRWRYKYVAFYVSNIAFVAFVIYVINVIQSRKMICSSWKIIRSYYEIYLMQYCCFIFVGSLGIVQWQMMSVSICLVGIVGYIMNRVNSSLALHIFR